MTYIGLHVKVIVIYCMNFHSTQCVPVIIIDYIYIAITPSLRTHDILSYCILLYNLQCPVSNFDYN